MGKDYRNQGRTSKTPRRPFEKERLDNEYIMIRKNIIRMQVIGKYGLKNKREVWRV